MPNTALFGPTASELSRKKPNETRSSPNISRRIIALSCAKWDHKFVESKLERRNGRGLYGRGLYSRGSANPDRTIWRSAERAFTGGFGRPCDGSGAGTSRGKRGRSGSIHHGKYSPGRPRATRSPPGGC